MAETFKIAILERNGEEFLGPVEIDAAELLQAVGIVAQEFEAFDSPGEETTTSGGWRVKSGFPYTTAVKTAGEYIIDHTVQCGNTDKEKRAGHQIQWRPGTSGSWQTLVDIRDANSVDNQFQLRSGFNIITLPSDSVFQVRVRYGQNDDGGVTRIKAAGIKIGKVLD